MATRLMEINITALFKTSLRPMVLPERREDELYYLLSFDCLHKKIPLIWLIASNTIRRGEEEQTNGKLCERAWKVKTIMAVFILSVTIWNTRY